MLVLCVGFVCGVSIYVCAHVCVCSCMCVYACVLVYVCGVSVCLVSVYSPYDSRAYSNEFT